MTPEAKLTAACIRLLKARKIWHLKIHGGPMQRAGMPDLLIVIHGRAVFVEFKAPGKKPSRLQLQRMTEIHCYAGASCWVVDNLDRMKIVIDKFLMAGIL